MDDLLGWQNILAFGKQRFEMREFLELIHLSHERQWLERMLTAAFPVWVSFWNSICCFASLYFPSSIWQWITPAKTVLIKGLACTTELTVHSCQIIGLRFGSRFIELDRFADLICHQCLETTFHQIVSIGRIDFQSALKKRVAMLENLRIASTLKRSSWRGNCQR